MDLLRAHEDLQETQGEQERAAAVVFVEHEGMRHPA